MLTATNTLEKNDLALEAISALARQFSENPDFMSLVNIFLMTISGQLASPSALMVFKNANNISSNTEYLAMGAFKDNKELEKAACSIVACPDLIHKPISWLPGESTFESHECIEHNKVIVSTMGLCARITHNNQVIAFLIIGPKVNDQPFAKRDCDMLSDLVSTLSPLLVNTYLLATIDQLNQWQQEVLDTVAQGLFIFDDKGTMKHINDQGCMVLTDISGDSPSNSIPINKIFPERFFPGWSRMITKIVLASDKRKTHHLRAVNQDGVEKIFRVRAFKLVSTIEQNQDLIVILDDVTGQRQSESKLFELEKLAEKGTMSSSISHELNNFLGLILGGVELSAKMLQLGNTEKVESYLDKLRTNVKKMERYTASLTDSARLNPEKTTGNLNSIISDVVSFVTPNKRFSGISIETELDPNLPLITIDCDQISQVLMNFINNAADAIAETERKDGRISLNTCSSDDKVYLSIIDNGVGIEPDRISDLFHYRFTTKKHGHGFGLVTCGKIISSHGGSVSIESKPGHGSTFIINLPLKD